MHFIVLGTRSLRGPDNTEDQIPIVDSGREVIGCYDAVVRPRGDQDSMAWWLCRLEASSESFDAIVP
jgi:hypothetical protein